MTRVGWYPLGLRNPVTNHHTICTQRYLITINMKLVFLTLAVVVTMAMGACDLTTATIDRASCEASAGLDSGKQCTCQKAYFGVYGSCGADFRDACNTLLDQIRSNLVGCSDLTCNSASTLTASIGIISVAVFSVMALF